MALQSIYDSAFTEKIPGRGRVPCFQRRFSVGPLRFRLYGKNPR
jgi:hypothetical protein